ncbi:MAG: ferrous iron transport protein A [Firmicutes bacterium]|jgi:Fe2+ transport system protein FeoA|nr:ferrous iron transport protein A [Bacillota bacterium]
MTLAEAKAGSTVTVEAFVGADQASEAIRLGIVPGRELKILRKITRGPLVVQAGVSQIAVGYHLARRITVRPVNRGVAGSS